MFASAGSLAGAGATFTALTDSLTGPATDSLTGAGADSLTTVLDFTVSVDPAGGKQIPFLQFGRTTGFDWMTRELITRGW